MDVMFDNLPSAMPHIRAGKLKALAVPAMQARLLELGANPSGNTPAEFARFVRAETEKWARVVKVSGAKVD